MSKKSVLAFVREHTFGSAPSSSIGHISSIEWDGRVVIGCECGGTIDTDLAKSKGPIENGIRWSGVPCSGCDKTFTIEGGP